VKVRLEFSAWHDGVGLVLIQGNDRHPMTVEFLKNIDFEFVGNFLLEDMTVQLPFYRTFKQRMKLAGINY